MKPIFKSPLLAAALFLGTIWPLVAGVTPKHLRCEYLTNPLGIDAAQPRLSWILDSSERGQKQTAYRLLAASTPAGLARHTGDLWDTGKVDSDQSIQVVYAGKPLPSGARVFWKVRSWDKNGKASAWSEPAFWQMGLLQPSDWKAQWIAHPAFVPPTIPARNGYHSALATNAETAKWVMLDLGEPREFDAVRLFPARPFNWQPDTPGFLFPVRFRLEVADTPDFTAPRLVVDRTNEDVAGPGTKAPVYEFKPVTARCVRLTATKLRRRNENQHGFALAEMQMLAAGRNVTTGAKVTALDSIEDAGWSRPFLVDGQPISSAGTRPAAQPVTLLRREFRLAGPVKRATLHATALGLYELRLNGRRAGEGVLPPEWTDYHTRVQYQTYDVTSRLRAGDNAISALLGDGWYAGRIGMSDGLIQTLRGVYGPKPYLLAQLEIELANGRRVTIASDGAWLATQEGPIRSSDLLDGEVYDARREMAGWDKAGFKPEGWLAVEVNEHPALWTRVSAQAAQVLDVAFPLTPALSPGERERSPQPAHRSAAPGTTTAREMVHPLTEGEGRGEGKWHVQSPAAAPSHDGIAASPSVILVAQPNEPIRVIQELKPIALTEPKPGLIVFDLGQNMVGRCRVALEGPAGTTVTIRHAEMLNDDGTLYTANLRGAPQVDRYTLRGGEPVTRPGAPPLASPAKGKGRERTVPPAEQRREPLDRGSRREEALTSTPQSAIRNPQFQSLLTSAVTKPGRGEGRHDRREPETYEPQFTQHGFRYVEISGLSRKPALASLVGRVFNSTAPEVGQFECSDPMLNKLWQNILWTQRANLMSVPTDCPQRDERLGWMGDIQAFSQTAIFNMDLAGFFTKWTQDIRDAQADDGRYADFSPHPFGRNDRFTGVPAWGDAGTVVPWRCYLNYGDTQLLERHWESAQRWVEFIRRENPDLIWRKSRGNDYNDWLNGDWVKQAGWPAKGGAVPNEVLATAFFAHSTETVAKMAEALGRAEDAKRYSSLCSDIKAAFHRAFVQADGRIQGDTQAGYALALHFDLLPEDLRPKAAAHLIEGVHRYHDHISTGIQTTHRLLLELTRHGANDLAWQLLANRTFPSWGYMIENGATTIWERWDGYVKGRRSAAPADSDAAQAGSFQDPGMNSFNHWALGSVGEWMIRHVLGLNPDEQHPGWKHFIIRPRPGGGVTWAKGHYDSIRGRIASDWKIEKGTLRLRVTVPANTTALVYVPTKDPAVVRESGQPAARAPGVRFLRAEDEAAVFAVGSGNYEFAYP